MHTSLCAKFTLTIYKLGLLFDDRKRKIIEEN